MQKNVNLNFFTLGKFDRDYAILKIAYEKQKITYEFFKYRVCIDFSNICYVLLINLVWAMYYLFIYSLFIIISPPDSVEYRNTNGTRFIGRFDNIFVDLCLRSFDAPSIVTQSLNRLKLSTLFPHIIPHGELTLYPAVADSGFF